MDRKTHYSIPNMSTVAPFKPYVDEVRALTGSSAPFGDELNCAFLISIRTSPDPIDPKLEIPTWWACPEGRNLRLLVVDIRSFCDSAAVSDREPYLYLGSEDEETDMPELDETRASIEALRPHFKGNVPGNLADIIFALSPVFVALLDSIDQRLFNAPRSIGADIDNAEWLLARGFRLASLPYARSYVLLDEDRPSAVIMLMTPLTAEERENPVMEILLLPREGASARLLQLIRDARLDFDEEYSFALPARKFFGAQLLDRISVPVQVPELLRNLGLDVTNLMLNAVGDKVDIPLDPEIATLLLGYREIDGTTCVLVRVKEDGIPASLIPEPHGDWPPLFAVVSNSGESAVCIGDKLRIASLAFPQLQTLFDAECAKEGSDLAGTPQELALSDFLVSSGSGTFSLTVEHFETPDRISKLAVA